MADRPILFSGAEIRALLDGRKTQHRLPIKGGVPAQPSMEVHHRHAARHERPYLDAYCSARKTPANPRGMSTTWCWWTRDDRMGRDFDAGYAPGDRLWVRETCRAEELSRPPRSRPATKRERQALGRTSVIECDILDGADGVRYLADDAWIKIENSAAAGGAWSDLYHGRGGRGFARGGRTVPSIHMPRWASRLTLLVTDVRVQRLQSISEADAIAEGMREPSLRELGGDLAQAAWSERQVFARLWERLHGAGAWEANPWVSATTFIVRAGNIDAPETAAQPREVAHA